MTTKINDFLGHKMLLRAERDVLIGCKWMLEDSYLSDSGSSEQEKVIIEMAISQISEYLEGKRTEFEVPLRLEGTEFRQKVWNELRNISYGQTITYKELAQRIGSPCGFRAVANACGANPFPILIPCHRVVASRGKSGGYTGGLDIKLSLLELENQNAPTFVV